MQAFKEATKNRFAVFLVVSGILIVAFSLLFDLIVPGRRGVGIAQLTPAIVGATSAILGIGLVLSGRETGNLKTLSRWLARIPALPNFFWVVMGIVVAYVLFLIFPMFFNANQRVLYFSRYIPDHYPIGEDLLGTLASINMWFTTGDAQYFYPPLLTVLFSPLLFLSYPLNYYVVTILTISSFTFLAILVSRLTTESMDRSVPLLIFGISFLSYGLQFELERGQFHTLAITLCIAAVYLFHRHPRYRFFAYVLFCTSVQFKLYPAIFVFMFVDDWRDWKTNLKRFVTLGFANFALLFLLGSSYFQKLVSHMTESGQAWKQVWNGNHSITGFFYYLLKPNTRILDDSSIDWLSRNIVWVISLFLVYFVICFLSVWLTSYRQGARRVDSFLLMACALGCLLLPSINHDYTLPILTAPFALLVSEQYSSQAIKRILSGLLLSISAFAYTVTLIPFNHKLLIFRNSFPLLMVLLTTTTLLSLLRGKGTGAHPVLEKLDA